MTEIKDIKEISARLSTENKKYVIAVANALLFSQVPTVRARTLKQPGKIPEREACQGLRM